MAKSEVAPLDKADHTSGVEEVLSTEGLLAVPPRAVQNRLSSESMTSRAIVMLGEHCRSETWGRGFRLSNVSYRRVAHPLRNDGRASSLNIVILAEDQKGFRVVIEVKVGDAKDSAIGQIARYLGWYTKTDGRPPRGILIAGDFSEGVRYAAAAVSNLTLIAFRVQFSFEQVAV